MNSNHRAQLKVTLIFPNFEMLDARITSALNKITQNSYIKKKGQSGGTESSERRRVPSRKTDRLLDLRLLPSHWHSWYMLISSQSLFATTTFRNSMRDGMKCYDFMTKIPPDDVLERLYKFRIRESDQLTTVLELYDMEIHQKISMLDDQKLKTMVKRSTDQKLRLRNFDARNEKIETGAVVTSRRRVKWC